MKISLIFDERGEDEIEAKITTTTTSFLPITLIFQKPFKLPSNFNLFNQTPSSKSQ
jgi:hypothetical protein